MNPAIKTEESANNKTTSPVVVVFEDDVTQAAAVEFCNDLIQRFWAQSGFDVTWCSFGQLEDPSAARNAAIKAKQADLVIFATRDVPPQIKMWIEDWLRERNDHEGAVVDLSGPVQGSHDTQFYLRGVAHRAGMDYLTKTPENMSPCIPDSVESCAQRADTVTNVLDEILRHQVPPPRLGGS